jgi:hypothetical protein
MCQLPDEDHPKPILSCKFMVSAGMNVTELSEELMFCLKSKLGK